LILRNLAKKYNIKI